MNKKLFLKLGLLISLTSLSLMACGQKDNPERAIDSSNNVVEHKSEKTEKKSSEHIEEKTVKNSQKNAQEKVLKNTQKNTQEKTLENSQKKTEEKALEKNSENIQEKTKQEINEKQYYTLIKEAWQNQKNYIDSIDDPKVKQSLQTPNSAAISKSTELLSEHPEDSKSIDTSLNKVLHGKNF